MFIRTALPGLCLGCEAIKDVKKSVTYGASTINTSGLRAISNLPAINTSLHNFHYSVFAIHSKGKGTEDKTRSSQTKALWHLPSEEGVEGRGAQRH